MIKYKLSIATIAVVILGISSGHAAIIDNGTYTTDTNSALDWLDLTETNGMSYNQVMADVELSGWRYATIAEVSIFFDTFGGDNSFYYGGLNTQNNGLFGAIAPLWGDIGHTVFPERIEEVGDGNSVFMTQGPIFIDGAPYINLGFFGTGDDTQDYVDISASLIPPDYPASQIGSALVRDAISVPEPTTFALISIGLLGTVCSKCRKCLS